jgi:hypothetical protein
VTTRPPAAERLANPEAFLSRSDVRELGLERRAVDAAFRACPVVSFPWYSRPLIRACDFEAFVEASTYRGDRVRAFQPAAEHGMSGRDNVNGRAPLHRPRPGIRR